MHPRRRLLADCADKPDSGDSLLKKAAVSNLAGKKADQFVALLLALLLGVSPVMAGMSITASNGIVMTGADGIVMTGADGIVMAGADGFLTYGPNGIVMTGADGIVMTGADDAKTGLQSVDPELAVQLNQLTDDRGVNAIVVYHKLPGGSDLEDLRKLDIFGGTRFRALPIVIITATRDQIVAISRLPAARSIYGNRTLSLTSEPEIRAVTGVERLE